MNVGTAHHPLDAAALEQLISAAVAAPSVHNTQPWRYRLRPETATLEVRAVPERALRAIDPSGRALHISIGASLFNLRVAARHLGWEPAVRLLPDLRWALRDPRQGHGHVQLLIRLGYGPEGTPSPRDSKPSVSQPPLTTIPDGPSRWLRS